MIKTGHGGDLKYYAKKYNIAQDQLVDFSANINPLGPPPEIFAIIEDSFKWLADYPEPNSKTLLEIGEKEFSLAKEKMIFGNGATELIFLLLNYLRPKRVFIPFPSFSEYERAGRAVGAEIKYFALEEDFTKIDNSFIGQLRPSDLVFICNPNNPTASYFKKEYILDLLEDISEKDAYLLLDESFIDFLDQAEDISLRKKLVSHDNLFILYSLTKIYSIPGLRLGLLFGPEEIISQLYKAKDPWNVNIFAQKTGEFLLRNRNFLEESYKYFSLERKRVYESLKGLPHLKVFPPAANFIFYQIENEKNTSDLQEFLIKDKIMIRDCSNYPGLSNKHFRTAIKKKEENDLLIKNIKEFFERS